ncbi:uncharacterized protein LOC124894147 [Capsicum annuum]|uniref:uncharacterized protein LOC124894147 n=1 Tax=Capsicum annuum TaxID=4072 RepID=UPI001FB13DCF|nr:uncharacterized protein LOC124894147 [Capsicum annuum]
MVNTSRQDWSRKLDDALWTYQIAFKTPTNMSSYQLFYGKARHLPIEMELKALWALKRLNLNLKEAVELRLGQLNEMDEFRLGDYERVIWLPKEAWAKTTSTSQKGQKKERKEKFSYPLFKGLGALLVLNGS